MLTILRMLASKAGWLLLSFVVIIAMLALWNELPAKLRDWRAQAVNAEKVAGDMRAKVPDFEHSGSDAVARADAEIATLKRAGNRELDRAEQGIARRQQEARTHVLDGKGIVVAAAMGRADTITDSYRAKYVQLPLLDRTAALIVLRRANLRDVAAHQLEIASFERARKEHNADVARYKRNLANLKKLQLQANAQWRNPVCERIQVPGVCDLVTRAKRLDAELGKEKRRLDRSGALLLARRSAIQILKRRREQVGDGAVIVASATRAYAEQAQRFSDEAGDNVGNRAKHALQRYGWQAFWIVLGAVLLPILHKLFAFLVIAPLAHRTQPVRLREGGLPLITTTSGISVKVPVDRDSELLLRAGLQSTATDIRGSDKYVLDWRMPLTCIAAGLVNLQRLRSDRPDYVVVTGTDQDHRVAAITVPAGGAVVLQPRALLGMVKRRGRRLVITRPWRIGWLISWITAQFRYVVFHGPCTLIVQGRNGVEIEDAARGRTINKRLTLGFDAALAYGAARSTSFLPYLRGQASLFNDRFDGTGSFLYEQRAVGGGKGSLWGRGLKGIGDAMLSALGI